MRNIQYSIFILFIVLYCEFFIGAVSAQTVLLKYVYSTDISPLPREIFAYDYQSGSALRIDAVNTVMLQSRRHGSILGTAGTSQFPEANPFEHGAALRIASMTMPQLLLAECDNIPLARTIDEQPSEFGGGTLEGTYPQGNRLMKLEDFPDPSRITSQRVLFDLDERGRLARIRHPDTSRETTFDLAEDSTTEISYVKSFANGAWVLEDVQIYPSGKPELFDPEYVVKLARDMAFETAETRRVAQAEQVSTPEGRRRLEQLREETIGSGLSESTKRFALILTGLIVIAVGSLAWWKNRS